MRPLGYSTGILKKFLNSVFNLFINSVVFFKFKQNIHLVRKWLPTLERLLERFGNNAHTEYRVFLSVQPPSTKTNSVVPQVPSYYTYFKPF
jgi:hypothetical protein